MFYRCSYSTYVLVLVFACMFLRFCLFSDSRMHYRNMFSNQSNISSLTTISNSVKQQMLSRSLCNEQEIRVTILRAFNLLDRGGPSVAEEEGDDNDDKIAGKFSLSE